MNSKYGFISDNKLYLVRCPKCNLENYALNVASGICSWCGYDGNKDEEFLLKSLKDGI